MTVIIIPSYRDNTAIHRMIKKLKTLGIKSVVDEDDENADILIITSADNVSYNSIKQESRPIIIPNIGEMIEKLGNAYDIALKITISDDDTYVIIKRPNGDTSIITLSEWLSTPEVYPELDDNLIERAVMVAISKLPR